MGRGEVVHSLHPVVTPGYVLATPLTYSPPCGNEGKEGEERGRDVMDIYIHITITTIIFFIFRFYCILIGRLLLGFLSSYEGNERRPRKRGRKMREIYDKKQKIIYNYNYNPFPLHFHPLHFHHLPLHFHSLSPHFHSFPFTFPPFPLTYPQGQDVPRKVRS